MEQLPDASFYSTVVVMMSVIGAAEASLQEEEIDS